MQQGANHTTAPSLPQLIASIINTPLPKIQKPSFIFDISEEAAINNFNIIAKAKGLHQAITNQQNSPISLGSEFRPPYLLEPLLSWHPFWPKDLSFPGKASFTSINNRIEDDSLVPVERI